MANVYNEESLVPHFNGLTHENLDEYKYDVESYVYGTKADDQILIGPRLLRRIGGVPGALARRELLPKDLATKDGYKLILAFLEKKGYKKDSLDRKLLARRRYEALARRQGQSLQEFFSIENMAYADALRDGVTIDDEQRSYHMLIKSGLTDDQINHIYAYLCEKGDSTGLTPQGVQDAVMKFYDKPWDVTKHRDAASSAPKYSRPFVGLGGQGAGKGGGKGGGKDQYRAAPAWRDRGPPPRRNYFADGYGDEAEMDDETLFPGMSVHENLAAEGVEESEYDDEGDTEAFLTGEADWLHREAVDSELFDAFLEEECDQDDQMHQAFVNYKEARDLLNQVRRGRGFWPVVAIPTGEDRVEVGVVPQQGQGGGGKAEGKGRPFGRPFPPGNARPGQPQKTSVPPPPRPGPAAARVAATRTNPLKSRVVDRTQCRNCKQTGHWEKDCPHPPMNNGPQQPNQKRQRPGDNRGFRRPPTFQGLTVADPYGYATNYMGGAAPADEDDGSRSWKYG